MGRYGITCAIKDTELLPPVLETWRGNDANVAAAQAAFAERARQNGLARLGQLDRVIP